MRTLSSAMLPPPASPLDEVHVTLVRSVLAGNAEAVDRWFRGEHPQVYRLCLGFLADEAEAEDAAQDAMLQLLDRLAAWDRSRPWRGWRNAVVLNLCRDRLRRADARERAHQRALSEREGSERGVLPDPGDVLERAEVQQVLRATLDALTPREREAFVLRDLEGHSTEEAAALLGIGESSVRSLLVLARRRLRSLLGERLPGLAGGGARD